MPGNTAFGSVNYCSTGTLTADSSVAGLGPANLARSQCSPSTGWQTAAGVKHATLTITAPQGGMAWQGFAFVNTNWTADAVITITLFQSGSPPTVIWTGSPDGPQPQYNQVIAIADQQYTADYVEIEINDPTNPDNHLNVGGAFAGPLWFPLVGISPTTTYGRSRRLQTATARGGQEYRSRLSVQRYWNFVLNAMRGSEAWDDADAMDLIASLGVNVLFIPDVTSPDVNRESVFGTLNQVSDTSFPSGTADQRQWGAQILERL